VREQLSEGHRGPGGGKRRQALADRVVQRERTLLDQRERGGAGERLGDARDAHVVGPTRPDAALDVAEARPMDDRLATPLDDIEVGSLQATTGERNWTPGAGD